MKSALALLALVASVSAEAAGAACTAPSGCTVAGQCCAYWKDNDTATTKKSTCQTAPTTDAAAAALKIDGASLTVKTAGSSATATSAPYLCFASSFPCATDNSATECQKPTGKVLTAPCCGAATIASVATPKVCFDPATIVAYQAYESTFAFKCNDAIKAGLSLVSVLAASMYLQ